VLRDLVRELGEAGCKEPNATSAPEQAASSCALRREWGSHCTSRLLLAPQPRQEVLERLTDQLVLALGPPRLVMGWSGILTAQSCTLTVCTEFANRWRTRQGLYLLAKSVCRQSARTNCSQTQMIANCWPTQFAVLANTTGEVRRLEKGTQYPWDDSR
jgi:hypothetical protein